MRTEGIWFRDEAGRALLLRGANLGGSTKVPARPNGATYQRDGFFEHRDVSFVGRPFPLDEAGEHFARLRAWGLTFCACDDGRRRPIQEYLLERRRRRREEPI